MEKKSRLDNIKPVDPQYYTNLDLIRHIDVKKPSDYRNPKVKALIEEAINFAIHDMVKPTKFTGQTISKIKFK